MYNFTLKRFALSVLAFLTYSFSYSQDVAVNEVMSSNVSTLADEDGDFNDWIELYNYSAAPVNLQGYGLTDDPTLPFKWVLPATTINPGQYLLVWASDKNRIVPEQPLHANFKISTGGETIVLTRPDNTIADQAPATALEGNVSIGRQPNGTGSWLFFYTPTPGAANTGQGLTQLLAPPVFSHESGLYTQAFTLTLTNTDPTAVIVYTLDGSEPQLSNVMGTTYNYKNAYKLEPNDPVGPMLFDTYTSNDYIAPINIYDRSAEADQLANKNTRQDPLYVPPVPVRKATVVKARAFVNGVGSKTIAKTYFVWAGGNPYDIPVISMQVQENYLFDYEDGIYTSGIDFDTWRANNPANNQWWRPEWSNYWRSGDLWEYPTHVEFFEGENMNSVVSLNAGFRIHGNNSRGLALKSLRLYARSEYDETDVFEHEFFDQAIPDATVPDNDKFKRLMLRGDGTGGPVAYDVVFNRVMQPVFNGMTRIKPAIHFMNGEFWGITAIRERFDKNHYALNFNLNEDNIVQIDCGGTNCELDEGTNADYQDYIDFRDFINQNSMAVNANYTQVATKLDIQSFIDHMVIEIYAANDSYERQFWKVRQPENQPYGDGKWRMTVQDFEASLKSNINWLEHWSDLTNPANESLLGNLLANPTFKNQFINRFADILNTAFITERFNAIVNQTFDEVAPYLPEDINRFPRATFYQNAQKTNLLNWGTNRPAIQRDQIRAKFGISNNVSITLNVSNTEAGIVKMNTVKIASTTPGVSANPYPWTGVYFNNVPVTVEAIAEPGFVFSHWSGDVSGTDPILTVTPTANMQIVANFSPEALAPEVIYFWMMNSAIANDTPLLSLTSTFSATGSAAAINYNSCLDGYPFTSAHPSWRKASMERRNAPTAINYRPEANNNAPYTAGSMRGIQVKQPFKAGSLENNIVLQFPTTGYENVKLSLAVQSNGAAQTLLADYWNGSVWVNTGLAAPSLAIASGYELKEFDFTGVNMANNNADFKIRLRFDGTDMFADTGLRVDINNIAIEAQAVLSTDNPIKEMALKVYPNPAGNHINVEANAVIDRIIIYSMVGQTVGQYAPQAMGYQVNLEQLPAGMYLLKVVSGDSEKTSRIIKK